MSEEIKDPTGWERETKYGVIGVEIYDEDNISISFTTNESEDEDSFFELCISIVDLTAPTATLAEISGLIEEVLQNAAPGNNPLMDIQTKLRDRIKAAGYEVESRELDKILEENSPEV